MSARPRILVVDDESIIALTLELKLEEMGYAVIATAHSGEDAVRLAVELQPDLVLMDIRLGDAMDGIEAAKHIREQAGVPVIFLTAFSDEETLQRAKLSEPLGYIQKPVGDRELRIVVEIALYRNRTEQALKLSEEKFRRVLETAIDAVISLDQNKRVIYFNSAAARLFGYDAILAVGMELRALIPENDSDVDREELDDFFAAAGALPIDRTLSLTASRRDGSEFPIELSIASWRTVDGVFFTAIIRDITERMLAEQNHRRNRELREINRAKDEFLAVVSHELRTPLTAMLGWTNLIRGGKLDVTEQKHAMNVIDRNIRTLKTLVEDLLDVSRIISGKMILNQKPLELRQLIETALQSIQATASAKNLKLTYLPDPADVIITGDQDRLLQVLNNVLCNAAKFTPDGGRIEIRSEADELDAIITVTDTGIGIEREFLPRIFDRFRQEDLSTTRTYQGLGLGLSIVRHLVELHGGNVQAESAGRGLGATFTIRLPLAALETASEPNGPVPAVSMDARPLENLLVLIVEDELDIRTFLSEALCQYGAVVKSAATADEAFRLFDSIRPDVLLCDIGLPGEDGYSLIHKIRALPQDKGGMTPAIALTGYARSQDRRHALDAGFQAHFTKPPDIVELSALVAYLGGRSR